MSEVRVKHHRQTDGSHCFVCGRRVPTKRSAKCGTVGLVWADTSNPIVTCAGHRGDLREVVASFKVYPAEPTEAETLLTCTIFPGQGAPLDESYLQRRPEGGYRLFRR